MLLLTLMAILLLFRARAAEPEDGDLATLSKRQNCGANSHMSPDAMLAMHNVYRRAAQEADLVWDEGLAQFAQCWASRCQFEHSHRAGYGENIACGNGYLQSPAIGIKNWWDEYQEWGYGSGYSEATGHFTQMAWTSTKAVGCGVADCSSRSLGLGGSSSSTFTVCSYWPAGNVIGQFNGHVKKPNYEPNIQNFISNGGANAISSVSHQNDYDSHKSNDNDANSFTGNRPVTAPAPVQSSDNGASGGGASSSGHHGAGYYKHLHNASPHHGAGYFKKGTSHAQKADGTSYQTYQPTSSSSSSGLLDSVLRRRSRRHHDVMKRMDDSADV